MLAEKTVIDASLAAGAVTLPVWLSWLPAVADITLIITPILALLLILVRIAVGFKELFGKEKT